MASTKFWGTGAAASFVATDAAGERFRWPGPARLAVIGGTAVLSWLPVAALGYACSKLIG